MSSVLRSFLALCALLLAAACSKAPRPVVPPSPDLLITGGRVIDGTGKPAVAADLVIDKGRIVFIGDASKLAMQPIRRIDATGKVVTPGFIDTHAHGDPNDTPAFENFLAQGVTTLCLGMDGSSPTGDRLDSWIERVNATQPAPNIAPFVGHGTVRRNSGAGYLPDPPEVNKKAMVELVRRAMEAGCWGITTGLEYDAGRPANEAELVATAKPVAEYGGLVMSHMRSEDDDAVEAAIDELLAQGKGAGCPVHISHFKVVYGKGPARAEELLAKLAKARAQGQTVTADVYPYTASHTGIGIVFPDWAKPPNEWGVVKRERRAELQAYLRERVNKRNGPEATLFGSEPWTGMTLKQAADEAGMPFEDLLIDRIGPSGASAAYFVMDEPLQARLLKDPNVMVCSDGAPEMHHPRGYGSFAKIIRHYVNETHLLTLEEAVHKMSGLPAQTIGLSDDTHRRGLLREGFAADVLVFDPARVQDKATFEVPHQLSEGFDTVIVNGMLVRDGSEWTGIHPGRVLLKREPAAKAEVPSSTN